MSPKPEMQNRYHQVDHLLPLLGDIFLCSSSENSHKHVYLTKPLLHGLDGAVSCLTLSFRLSSYAIVTAFSVAKCYRSSLLWLQEELLCLQKHQQAQFIPFCFQFHSDLDLVQIVLLLTCAFLLLTSAPYLVVSSVPVMPFSARLAFGLLSFQCNVQLSTYDCIGQCIKVKEGVFLQFEFIGISLHVWVVFFLLFFSPFFSLSYSYANTHIRLLHIQCGGILNFFI